MCVKPNTVLMKHSDNNRSNQSATRTPDSPQSHIILYNRRVRIPPTASLKLTGAQRAAKPNVLLSLKPPPVVTRVLL